MRPTHLRPILPTAKGDRTWRKQNCTAMCISATHQAYIFHCPGLMSRLSYRTGEMQQKKLLRCYSPNSKQKGPSTFLANGASVCSESDTTI
ncbi:uncharacterized protein LOC119274808 isoform X2 [Triticum dicoccoides]|uniref:uncharacterized protein LOC119274808 isoform X2 n=1 Tax=Triticum dicoccoides TaxID=85692 RepID=UPI00189084D6|nr:uncharacterized protein LOC119274808 isoform X2 [Triticum dicoccoides]